MPATVVALHLASASALLVEQEVRGGELAVGDAVAVGTR